MCGLCTKIIDDTWCLLQNGDARMVYPWGVESGLGESINGIKQKYGSMQGLEFSIWFDVIKHQELADGVYLVTWQPWERIAGSTLHINIKT